MMGSRQLSRLLEEAHRHHAKVVLVGDPYQLQAIEAGAAFRAISEQSPGVALTEIRRQQVSWQREATVELARGETEAARSIVMHSTITCMRLKRTLSQSKG